MKRIYVLLVVAVIIVAVSAVVWAARDITPRTMPASGAEGREMAMARPGMGGMGGPAIAVSGNSVYVVAGGMILKYSEDLTLVKQAELPMREGVGGGAMGRSGMRGGRGGTRGGTMRRNPGM